MKEVERKLKRIREKMSAERVSALRLRGVDWFAWATGGGDSTVAFNEEAGVAEVLITESQAWILTNRIEAERIRAGEAGGLEVVEFPWESQGPREAFVRGKAKAVHSDYPRGEEQGLSETWRELRLQLEPEEVARYRSLGTDAAKALTTALQGARGEMTEGALAGLAAQACWNVGIQPILTMAAGENRLLHYRHPITKLEKLGRRGMIVICGRRNGLFANVTRHVFFGPMTEAERRAQEGVLAVEAAVFRATEEGLSLPECYGALSAAYANLGTPAEVHRHHQGGSCGYRTREEVASPESPTNSRREGARAYAWNPSLPGAKIEDTVLRHPDGKLEILTVDPAWPTTEYAGRKRPAPDVRA